MSLPILLTSSMVGAPQLTATNGSINAILFACLVNGFGSQSVSSATASGGVVNFTLPSTPNFAAKNTVTISGATNGSVNGSFRVSVVTGNVVSVPISGIADGAITGSITMKFSPLGWTRPYSGTGIGCYKQGGTQSHKRFVRIYDNTLEASASRFYMRAYENMTSVSAGTGPFPDLTEIADNGGDVIAPYNSGNFPWLIIGTPRQYYFFNGYSSDYSASSPPEWPTLNPWTDIGASFFGDLDRIQKPADIYAQVISKSYNFPSEISASRDYAGNAGSRPTVSMVSPFQTPMGGSLTFPSPASGNVLISDAPYIRENSNGSNIIRGFMPGVLCPAEALMDGTTYGMGSILTNVSNISGRLMLVCGYSKSGGEFLMKLDEDWGDS